MHLIQRAMTRFLNIFLIILFTTTAALSQPRRGQMDRRQGIERIHAAKIAYITNRLHLTAEQSGNFIPLYNEYEAEIRNTRQAFFNKYKGTEDGNAGPETYRQYIDDNLDYQQQVIDIKRKYNDRFLKIISPRQLADLGTAEREFRQILMKQLDKRGNQRFNNRRNGNGY